jgi:hypothetical protein
MERRRRDDIDSSRLNVRDFTSNLGVQVEAERCWMMEHRIEARFDGIEEL